MKRAAPDPTRLLAASPGPLPTPGGKIAFGTKEHLTRAVVQQRQRQPDVALHSERVAQYALALGQVLGLTSSELILLGQGAQLHDWGKLWVPNEVLNKPGSLTAAEFQLVACHPVWGDGFCAMIPELQPLRPLVRHHHERWDGSGYPDGLAGDRIPELALVLQVADIYDALTQHRSYHQPHSPAEAMAILQSEASRGWRRRDFVDAFGGIDAALLAQAAELLHSWPALAIPAVCSEATTKTTRPELP